MCPRRLSAGTERVVCSFPARELPKTAAARFAALFEQRSRWTRDDIAPYLEA